MKHMIAYEGKVHTSLAAMQEAYVPLFAPAINRRTGVEGTTLRPPYTIEFGKEWVQKLSKSQGKDEVFAVLARSGKSYRYIGHMGIHGIDRVRGSGTTGSILIKKNGRSKGHGTEAKLLLLYHCFHVLGLRKVHSTIKAWNAASLGHLLKTGYRIVGRRKEEIFHEGKFIDEILLEVFPDDFNPIWDHYQRTHILPKLSREQRALVQKETSS